REIGTLAVVDNHAIDHPPVLLLVLGASDKCLLFIFGAHSRELARIHRSKAVPAAEILAVEEGYEARWELLPTFRASACYPHCSDQGQSRTQKDREPLVHGVYLSWLEQNGGRHLEDSEPVPICHGLIERPGHRHHHRLTSGRDQPAAHTTRDRRRLVNCYNHHEAIACCCAPNVRHFERRVRQS